MKRASDQFPEQSKALTLLNAFESGLRECVCGSYDIFDVRRHINTSVITSDNAPSYIYTMRVRFPGLDLPPVDMVFDDCPYAAAVSMTGVSSILTPYSFWMSSAELLADMGPVSAEMRVEQQVSDFARRLATGQVRVCTWTFLGLAIHWEASICGVKCWSASRWWWIPLAKGKCNCIPSS